MNPIRLSQLAVVMLSAGLLAACDRAQEAPADSRPDGMPAPPSSPSAPPASSNPPAAPPTDTAPSSPAPTTPPSGSGTGDGSGTGSGMGSGDGSGTGTGTGTGTDPQTPDQNQPVTPNSSSAPVRAHQVVAWERTAGQTDGVRHLQLASAGSQSAWAQPFGARERGWAQ